MKTVNGLICIAVTAAALAGCGGGGDTPGTGTNSNPQTQTQATKASTKVSLFGTMSSNSRIATVQTAMTVPAGIMVNYSSPPGATSGTYPLRKGVVIPSGSVKVAESDIHGTFDISSRKLLISLLNNPANLLQVISGTSGNGEEILTLNFDLAVPGEKTAMPTQDSQVVVSQDRGNTAEYLSGCIANFLTTYE